MLNYRKGIFYNKIHEEEQDIEVLYESNYGLYPRSNCLKDIFSSFLYIPYFVNIREQVLGFCT